MSNGDRIQSSALTKKVRAFDKVENPNTLEGYSMLDTGCAKGTTHA